MPNPGSGRTCRLCKQGIPDLAPSGPEAREILVQGHVVIAQKGGEVGRILADQSIGRLPEQRFVSGPERSGAPGDGRDAASKACGL